MFSFFFGSPTEEKSKKQKKRARAQKKKKDAVTLAPIGVDDEGKNDDDEGRSDDESDDEGDEPDVFLPIQVPTERLTAELNLEASNLGKPAIFQLKFFFFLLSLTETTLILCYQQIR